jgi:hypothetical protein
VNTQEIAGNIQAHLRRLGRAGVDGFSTHGRVEVLRGSRSKMRIHYSFEHRPITITRAEAKDYLGRLMDGFKGRHYD